MKTPRKARGEWYKAIREDAVEKIRERMRNQANDDLALDRGGFAIFLVGVYYKLLLRLPDLEQFKPEWAAKAHVMADYCEDQLRLFAPYLKLKQYEQKPTTSINPPI